MRKEIRKETYTKRKLIISTQDPQTGYWHEEKIIGNKYEKIWTYWIIKLFWLWDWKFMIFEKEKSLTNKTNKELRKEAFKEALTLYENNLKSVRIYQYMPGYMDSYGSFSIVKDKILWENGQWIT